MPSRWSSSPTKSPPTRSRRWCSSKVLEEDRPVNGRDFFEPPGVTEKLADTPAVIARIWRGTANRRRMIVSAADSFDVNKKPLTFTWVVLRGDDKQITITPRNKAGSEVEIVVPYHPRRPVLPGSPLESNRVDIGVFVHNGAYYSAPGFVTYCTLDNECRAYDEKGRVVEIGYGVGEVEVRVSDYAELDKAMSSEGGMAAKVFKLTAEERDTFENHGRIYRRSAPVMASLREKTKTHEAARAALDVELKQARAKLDAAQKTHAAKPSEESKAAPADWTKTVERIVDLRKRFDDELVKVRKATADVQKAIDLSQATVDEFVIPFLKNAWRDPALVADHYEVFLAELKKASQVRKVTVQTELKRLFELGFLTNPDGGELEWQRIRKNFTPFQRFAIESLQRHTARRTGAAGRAHRIRVAKLRRLPPLRPEVVARRVPLRRRRHAYRVDALRQRACHRLHGRGADGRREGRQGPADQGRVGALPAGGGEGAVAAQPARDDAGRRDRYLRLRERQARGEDADQGEGIGTAALIRGPTFRSLACARVSRRAKVSGRRGRAATRRMTAQASNSATAAGARAGEAPAEQAEQQQLLRPERSRPAQDGRHQGQERHADQ